MTKIPFEAMEPEFIASLRDRFVQQEPTARRLGIATNLANELGRSYLDGALSKSREEIREILLGIITYRPDEDDEEPGPDHRGPASLLFLHGVNAGYWKATADGMDLARALVITTYGPEVLKEMRPRPEPKLEKTKVDLAKEAGLPTTDYTYQKPRDSRPAKKLLDDYFYVQQLCDECDLIAVRRPRDIDALRVALKRYLDALKIYFPFAYEAQTAHLRRVLAPMIAKGYVDLVEKAHG